MNNYFLKKHKSWEEPQVNTLLDKPQAGTLEDDGGGSAVQVCV